MSKESRFSDDEPQEANKRFKIEIEDKHEVAMIENGRKIVTEKEKEVKDYHSEENSNEKDFLSENSEFFFTWVPIKEAEWLKFTRKANINLENLKKPINELLYLNENEIPAYREIYFSQSGSSGNLKECFKKDGILLIFYNVTIEKESEFKHQMNTCLCICKVVSDKMTQFESGDIDLIRGLWRIQVIVNLDTIIFQIPELSKTFFNRLMYFKVVKTYLNKEKTVEMVREINRKIHEKEVTRNLRLVYSKDYEDDKLQKLMIKIKNNPKGVAFENFNELKEDSIGKIIEEGGFGEVFYFKSDSNVTMLNIIS